MQQKEITALFERLGVMKTGHFALTSGRHSEKYMQCARLFEYPEHSARLCAELAARFDAADVVVGPALGGVIMAYEVARALKARNVFAERQDGVMTLKRGFAIEPGERVLVVEDVVTTGGSVKEVLALCEAAGAQMLGVAVIVDRSGGKADFGCRLESLVQIEIDSFAPDECPLCEKGLPIDKPGSRVVVRN